VAFRIVNLTQAQTLAVECTQHTFDSAPLLSHSSITLRFSDDLRYAKNLKVLFRKVHIWSFSTVTRTFVTRVASVNGGQLLSHHSVSETSNATKSITGIVLANIHWHCLFNRKTRGSFEPKPSPCVRCGFQSHRTFWVRLMCNPHAGRPRRQGLETLAAQGRGNL
jgi:hypothetical protein